MIWIIGTIFFAIIVISDILLVIGAGLYKTEKDRINEREEEAKYWKEYEKERIQRNLERTRKKQEKRNKIVRIFKRYLHIL